MCEDICSIISTSVWGWMLNNFYQCVLVVVLVAVCGDKCWYRGYNERLPRMRGKEKETIRDKLGPICRLYVYSSDFSRNRKNTELFYSWFCCCSQITKLQFLNFYNLKFVRRQGPEVKSMIFFKNFHVCQNWILGSEVNKPW